MFILKKLRNYEQDSPFLERPLFVNNVYQPVITPTMQPDPQMPDTLWQQTSSLRLKPVLFKGSSNHMKSVRIGSQVFETTIAEQQVPIDNKVELEEDRQSALESAYQGLSRVKNPLEKQLLDREINRDETIDRSKVNKHVENNILYNRLENDLNDLS